MADYLPVRSSCEAGRPHNAMGDHPLQQRLPLGSWLGGAYSVQSVAESSSQLIISGGGGAGCLTYCGCHGSVGQHLKGGEFMLYYYSP